ncbi:hypothetical protein CLHUN_12970 [Ruminiclostridium hungatei]|uniref:Uncharacterized protein n=1 Tax=Ruminiclostridium hungatei TaxID=48256 RepID=A0A1V4SNM1_RUMHU|nr:hypothetical protein [Ruminiclostridium hungatei]OPX45065.1 hypothetical protein CLHUN_12970 [Ruminiclostridium hungatei]
MGNDLMINIIGCIIIVVLLGLAVNSLHLIISEKIIQKSDKIKHIIIAILCITMATVLVVFGTNRNVQTNNANNKPNDEVSSESTRGVVDSINTSLEQPVIDSTKNSRSQKVSEKSDSQKKLSINKQDNLEKNTIKQAPIDNYSVTTGEADIVNSSTVTLYGKTGGFYSNIEECGFILGKDKNKMESLYTCGGVNSTNTFFISPTNLQESQTYYYKAYIKVNSKYYYGSVLSFSTSENISINNSSTSIEVYSITTGEADIVNSSTVTLHGKIGQINDNIEECGFILGKDKNKMEFFYTYDGIISTDTFAISPTNLQESQIYFYKAYLKINSNYYYGEILSFCTNK